MVQKIRKAKPKQKEEKVQKNKLSKFIKKKSKYSAQTKRDNTYVFEGFYEKLKQIDVKQSNNLETNFVYDSILKQSEKDDEEGLFNSNFIMLLRTEKANNKTIEFSKVYKVLEPFCFSYPILVLNKSKLINMLIQYLTPKDNGKDAVVAPIYAIQISVLDLLIALIKDFRQDIYQEFLNMIMPAVISVIDMQKIQILDKVFTVISFGVKYLNKSIKEDLENFCDMYSELLIHKNRYIRKFASQSISYVLRKISFNQNTIKLLAKILQEKKDEDEVMEDLKSDNKDHLSDSKLNRVLGLADLLFEVVYGAGEGLHSKYNEVMDSIFDYLKQNEYNQTIQMLIRCLLLKQLNEVDTEKQQPIFDMLISNLKYNKQESDLNLILDIFKDQIRLKYGKRLSNYGVIQMLQVFNNLLNKNLAFSKQLALETKKNLARTIQILYYFKHNQVRSILAKSSIDLQQSQTIFNSHIYKLIDSTEHKIELLHSYYEIILSSPSEIKGFDDLDWSSILGLKQSSKNVMEFSGDSHQWKIKTLIKSINQYVLKYLQDSDDYNVTIEMLAMFICLASKINEKVEVELNDQSEKKLVTIIKAEISDLQRYFVFRFLQNCKVTEKLNKLLKITQITGSGKKQNGLSQKIDFSQLLMENLVLNNYNLSEQDYNDLQNALASTIDLVNIGQSRNLVSQNQAIKEALQIQQQEQNSLQLLSLLRNAHDDIIVLKSINQSEISSIQLNSNKELFTKLSLNLAKNQTELRLQTLLLLQKFEVLHFIIPDSEDEKHFDLSESYKGECKILELMLTFEQTKIAFETEKTKILLIKKIQTVLETELVPVEYVEAAYNFLIGGFWIKFTPLFESIQETIGSIINHNPEIYGKRLLELMKNYGLLTQVFHDNQILTDFIQNKIASEKSEYPNQSLLYKSYIKEQTLNHEFLEVKDFFYNLTKTIQLQIDPIMSNTQLRQQLMSQFYDFIDKEFRALNSQRQQKISQNQDLLDRMTYANMIDSDQYTKYKRQTYSKLYCYVEIFNRADNLKNMQRLQDFQNIMLKLLVTSDTKLQKLSLDCLIKSEYRGGLLKHYRKLLEGFTDDEKFKDVILALNFGSQKQAQEGDQTTLEQGDAIKKSDKSAIPKLQDMHRNEILPIVIKLLLSKLLKKKGSINQKTVFTRRNIVYNFMSSLNPDTELFMFINETLSAFEINYKDHKDLDFPQMLQKLSEVSFSVYLNYISSLAIIIKQLGGLLSNFLPLLTKVLVAIMTLTKMFIKQLKLSLVEEKEDQISLQVTGQSYQAQDGNQKDSLYRFVGHQSKASMRKALGIAIQLYSKFNYDEQFVKVFSGIFYTEVICDQIPLLHQNNYLTYKDVLPALMKMLEQKKIVSEVYEMIFSLLKNLISKSINGLEEKKDLHFIGKRRKNQKQQDEDQDDLETMEIDKNIITKEREIAKIILEQNISQIARSISIFSQNNLSELKNALLFKKKQQQKQNKLQALGGKQSVHETNQETLKDIIYIMSELTHYLKEGDKLNEASLKSLHTDFSSQTNSTTFYEELLLYSVKSICSLLQKSPSVSKDQIEKIILLFLTVKSLKVRNLLSKGLLDNLFVEDSDNLKVSIPDLKMKRGTIEIICNLNKIKRGLADTELDYDLIIKTLEKLDINHFRTITHYDLRQISYSVLFLLQSDEFSVRDYSCHFLKQFFEHLNELHLIDQTQVLKEFGSVIAHLESFLLQQVKTIKDELVLKTILEALRLLIIFYSKTQGSFKSQQNLQYLNLLVSQKEDQDDFFNKFLAIKLKSRAKQIQMLISKLQNKELSDYKAIQAIIIPLLNYIIFGTRSQKESRRNTVSYSKQEKRMIMDEALKAYSAIASLLKWSDYYKMLKQLLYKLNKSQSKISFNQLSGGNKGEDGEKQKERVITKCICQVLNGFKLSQENTIDEEYDAVKTLKKQQQSEDDQNYDQDFENIVEKILKENEAKPLEQFAVEVESDDNLEEDEEQQLVKKQQQELKVQTDKNNKMLLQNVQQKLYQKVLPILERHFADYEEKEDKMDGSSNETGMNLGYGSIRSFVVLGIAKLIRKLPIDQFINQLSKLINNIISKGLRSRLLVHREKARKSLLKLLIEVSPQFLSLSFTIMNDLLTRGYQLQTYIFTILFLLQQLVEKKILKNGMVSHRLLEITSEKLMDELFGELVNDDKNASVEDQQKNKIKEAKGKKAIPIFEIFAQFIDFKKNFFTLIGPIIRSLEGNPSIGKIQQCEELLNRISSSIIKNESVRGDQLLMFMYSIIDKGVIQAAKIKINDERAKRDYGAKTMKEDTFRKTKKEYKEMTFKIDMKWTKGNQLVDSKKAEELSGRVLASFGLMCMKKALKNKGLILSNEDQGQQNSNNFLNEDLNSQIKKNSEDIKEELKAKLDPFVPLLLNAFKTYHNPIVVSTLHVLGMIIHLGLPSFQQLMKKFLNRLFKLFEQTSTSSSIQDSDFVNSLFKCTAELIKTYSTYQDLNQLQLKTLIQVIKQNLNSQGANNPSQINVFHLLRALVFRKFLSPDLYDIIDKNVQDLIITSLSPSVRSLCSSIFVTFLIEYPLEQERLTQHLNFLLKNVGTYFDQEGRHQILEVMEKISIKMPQEILDNECEKWTFTLMIRLVNEKNKRCKDKAAQVLRMMFVKISANKTKTIFNTIIQMNSENAVKRQSLMHAKLHLLSIMIESIPALFKNPNDIKNIIADVCMPIITDEYTKFKKQLDKKKQAGDADDSQGEDDEIQNENMRKFFQSIDLMENNDQKLITINDDESEDKDQWSPLYYAFENINKLLTKSETQSNAFKLLAKYIRFLPQLSLIITQHHIYWIKLVAHQTIQSFLKNMINSKLNLTTLYKLEDSKDQLKIVASYTNTFKSLPMTSDLSKILVDNQLTLLRQQLNQKSETQLEEVKSIFKKLSLIGRKIMLNINQASERLECILRFFMESLSLFEEHSEMNKDNQYVRAVVESILQLVFRIYTDDQYLQNTPPKTLSYQMVDYFSNNLEKAFFLTLYNQVKKSILDKRQERKRHHKIMMVSNAVEWEQIKAQKRDKKRDKKREKKRQEKIMMNMRKN
ncbi:small subunit processome component 20 homolog [Stylonychia lemnae]|uniref:Small subunit processome component 20 homolog n=1 Tax=Stylonychia lemnae TaxID=5949 RepID=A0A078AUE0_STYLE|nr:small subunit processome component 20 homolog [Stylonychia lemnae]|eukprot:CDW84473.1 small subunit processome component 20 homolog [Stylonychia lemnae]